MSDISEQIGQWIQEAQDNTDPDAEFVNFTGKPHPNSKNGKKIAKARKKMQNELK
jgi:hypothetical protein